MKEKLKDRYVILAICFLIFGIIITLQLANLQIIQGAALAENSQHKVLKERKVVAARGKILDRNGVPIAVNRQGFAVHIVKTGLKDNEFNEMLLRLSYIFEKNGDSYYKSLEKYLTFKPLTFNKKSPEEIKKWLKKDAFAPEEDEQKAIDALKSPEDVFKYLRRSKPFKISDDYSDEDAYRIMTLRYEILADGWNFRIGNSVCLARDISEKTVAEIEEKNHLLPGVSTDIEPVRKYIDAQIAAHVLGYVRPISSEQLEKYKDEGYGPNDIIGQAGIELAAERYLRGKDGQKRVEVNTSGRLTEELNGNPAIPGNDVILTIDMNLQKVAMESLERNIKAIREMGGKNNFGDANAGAVVAIDVHSGEVLTMASYPGYNSSIFLEGKDNKEAQKAISDLFDPDNVDKPALNRAIAGAYAPGSTFKPLTAIAALEEGVITPDRIIYDSGTLTIGGWEFKCLEYRNGLGAHGRLDLKKALETSCNIYFHQIGYETSIDKMNKWAIYFGLGQKTGIDIGGESEGVLASRKYKKERFNDDWRPADTAQAAIGQIYNSFTPLQLANYMATLANGGKRYSPHLIKRVVKYDGSIVNEIKYEPEKIPIKQSTINAVKEGMVAVTHSVDGTAAKVFADFPYKVAGKTGTAQTGLESKHSSNALFVCYAPADDPKIAIAVVVEKGAWGSYTAPIAKDILTEYFGLNSGEKYDDKIKTDEAVFTH